MLRKYCWIIALLGLFTANGNEVTNLLKNPSFENGKFNNKSVKIVEGWTTRPRHYANVGYEITTEAAHTGKRSAKIIGTISGKTGYFASSLIKVAMGTRLKLSLFYRFQPEETSAELYAVVQCRNSKGRDITKRQKLKSVKEWTKIDLFFQLPDNEPQGYNTTIQFKLTGKGQAWVDDLSLTAVEPEKNIVEFYPSSVNTERALYPLRGESSPLLFYVYTNGKPAGRVLTIDVPEKFVLKGAAQVFTPKTDDLEVIEEKKAGRIIYQIKLSKYSVLPIKRSVKDIFTGTALLFKAADDLKEDVINWSINGIESGQLKIIPQEPVKGKKLPKNFVLYSWYMPILNQIPSDDAVKDYISTLKKSGIIGGSIHSNRNRQALMKEQKFANIHCLWYESKNKCWSHLLNTPKLKNYFINRLEGDRGFDSLTMVWNYEPGLSEYYHFCNECKEAFEKETGKSLSRVSSGEEAEKLYPKEYLKFRNQQIYKIVKLFADLCHQYGAKAILNSYVYLETELGHKNFIKKIGDVRSYSKFLDNYSSQIYFQPEVLWDRLAANLKYYPGMIPCYTSDERHNRMPYSYSLLTPEQVYIETAIAAIHGCKAIHFFVGVHTFDGRQHNALRKAMDEISRYEDFFFDGKVDSNSVSLIKSSRHVRYRAFRLKDKVLLAIVNPDQIDGGYAKLKLTPNFGKYQIYEPEKKQLIQIKGTKTFENNQEALFELKPCEVRYILLDRGQSHKQANVVELKTELELVRKFQILDKGDFSVAGQGISKNNFDTIQIISKQEKWNILVNDGAVLTKEKRVLFRDNLFFPSSSAWSRDFSSKYEFTSCAWEDGGVKICFNKKLNNTVPAGLVLNKTYIFHDNGKSVDVHITIKNSSQSSATLAYWSWNQPGIKRNDYILNIPGALAWKASDVAKENNYFPVSDSSWGKVSNQVYLGWSAARPQHRGHEINKFYIWNGGEYPTFEMLGNKQELKPGKEFKIILHYREVIPLKKTFVAKQGDGFSIINPYAKSKKLVLRASLHNHAQYAPTYKHAPIVPAQRLKQLQEADVNPRYGIVSITEHNRITLPINTLPKNDEPQWGVKGILFVPGIEKTMGSWTHGSAYGYLFGEMNCVGVSKECTNPLKQETYRHNNFPYAKAIKPEEIIGLMVKDGAYVGLCHPNASYEKGGAQRWGSSGYNYDELDIIFGNSEKRMPPLAALPLGLEIGNQGYDFTVRSKFKNGEEKWDMLLGRGHRLVGTASDDAHHQAPMAGWCVMFIDELNEKEFLNSLRNGNFYSSQGPKLTKIKLIDQSFHIATDQPSTIEFIGKGGKILQKNESVKEAAYKIKGDEIYVRGRVTRICPQVREIGGGIGKKRSAWTNPLYIVEKNRIKL